ncbi:PBP1A family penicillin-binding protein [Candidatus Woesebacteria bacterium]|nr:PBP1A family penicillin-binding protein [Candidatus Woesebacteria bacterium]HOC07278.1 PBP1A family penicillin-binding protein [Candidatus Woesebacteria bacterium]HOP38878.1 PBP1A family penicillin-binding protein [Candidatus Woesebacteria bacterium]HPK08099.1 PBP1A family penicillin-binding protein [Candidatus Woesebacteria bacterium]
MDDLSEQTVITDELKPPAPQRKISLWRRLQWLLRRLRTKLVIGWEKFLYLIMPKKSRLHRNKLSPSEKKLRRIKTWRTIALVFCGLVVLGIIVFLVMFFWFSKDLPQPGEVIRREGYSSKIYDRNGELLYDLFQEERRQPSKAEEIPAVLKNATVAIEDRDFYKHSGFDFLTIIRIPYNLIFRKRVVGGSTLTQQLVKNALLTNERTIVRKFKELVLAIQIERKFSKDEILTMYLNEAPYGGNIWGVATAVETYFAKPMTELTIVESAFLAGLPQRPSVYSPYSTRLDENGEPYWKMRTRTVLKAMKDNAYITNEEYEQALKDIDSLTFNRTINEIKAPHFVFYVQNQLEEMFGEELLLKGGLTVTTTLDWELQELAQTVVTEEVEDVARYDISNGAALAMQPQTGEILAMVGSKDYFDEAIGGQFNVAVDGLRQPGSAIKPITYLGMIKRGFTPATMIMDVPTTFARNEQDKPYTPKNYDGQFRGPVSLRQSLGSSLNIPAVKSLATVGLEEFLTLAYEMGIETFEPTVDNLQRFGLALTLGGGEVYMLDLASAYSIFANGGLKVEPIAILKVTDSDGKVLFEHKQTQGKRVIEEGEAFLINHILSDNNARLLAFGPNSLLNTGRPIAVKTGTTNDMKDNWTIGWSREILVASWVGNNDNSSMSYVASGITGASPIWRRIILGSLDMGYAAPDWQIPDTVEQVEVDAISGYPSHDNFPSKFDYAIRGTVPSSPDPIHRLVEVCKGENDKLATEAKIAAGDYDKREFIFAVEEDPVSEDGVNRWQIGIDAWIASQDDSRYRVPTEYCGDLGDVSVRLKKPNDQQNFKDQEVEVEIRAGSYDGIEKLELYVNDKLLETIVGKSEYQGKINLAPGKYELFAKAYAKNGKDRTSDKVRIGVGGIAWDYVEPTPTPLPTPTIPPATPTLTPTPTPTIQLSPSQIPVPGEDNE